MAAPSSVRAPWWWKLVAPHRRSLVLGFSATILCSLAAAWVPYWSGRAVHALETGAYPASRRALAWMLAFTIVAGVGRYLMRNILIGLSREVERLQRQELYDSLLARSFAFFEQSRIGDLMSRMGDDVNTVRMATGPGLMSLLQTASLLPMTFFLMLHASPRLAMAVIGPFSLLAGGFYVIGKWSHRLQQKIQLVNSQLNTFSHETISGEKVVQAFGLEDLRVSVFEGLSRKQARMGIAQTMLYGAYMPLSALTAAMAALVLVAYGGSLVLKGQLTLGDLTAFTGYLATLAWPIMSLGWSANLFQRGRAGQERIDQVLHDATPFLPAPGEVEVPAGPAALKLEGAVHRFESGRGVGPLDLDLAAGSRLAVVGGIGSGKTVLLQMLAGLRTLQGGSLLLDGAPLDEGRLRSHWAGIGWVPQEAFLFSLSLRENLALGRPGAPEEDLWEVARVVCLDDLIRRLPGGLDTVVGERGVILSGGERQRTALARALLRRPRLLILDDALSAVDAETESRILENLRGFLGDTTLVLATHRVFVAELCDQVLVLEDGAAAQRGTPQELAQEPGHFARIKRLQSLEREILGEAAS
ncbi:ABC transporter ATP-binding protein [Mesoterricola sediminis]|uniref:ABC transporter ATP-binding protein n=1 Tax=Mesoterricola sediminis TaxID=2927980 RepID=A0AA48HA26_9BACT|nr:ABC transporter ATP-binding protein [Mesoterricola sediminis]BDU78673.1 ABC transporter ATP-binding protein [Mesoterricola sediminis]